MRRRGTVNRKPAKTQQRKPTRSKRSNAPTVARRRSPSAADLQKQLDQRTRERDEALDREKTTAEVLRVINSSPGELEPVFQTMLENATRLCEAEFGNLFLYDGESFRTVALYQASQAYAEARQRPFLARDLHPDVPLVRIILSKAIINIADVRTERSYIAGDP